MIYEGDHRVPMIVRWEDGSAAGSVVRPGSVSDALVSANDWMATCYDLTGQRREGGQAMDSVSLLPVITEQK